MIQYSQLEDAGGSTFALSWMSAEDCSYYCQLFTIKINANAVIFRGNYSRFIYATKCKVTKIVLGSAIDLLLFGLSM